MESALAVSRIRYGVRTRGAADSAPVPQAGKCDSDSLPCRWRAGLVPPTTS